MNDPKTIHYLNAKLGDRVSYDTKEDLFKSITTEYDLGVPVNQTVKYSSQLEEFIRQIAHEEVVKALEAFKNGIEGDSK